MKYLSSPRYYLPCILILLLTALPLFVTSPYYLHIITMVFFWAYLATAWNIVGGFAGQLSLGHGVYVAAGAYTSSLIFVNLGISPWLGMIIGGLVAAVLGIIVGYPTLRLKGAYYALATVGFAEGFRVILVNTEQIGSWKTGGAEGFMIPLLGNAPQHMQFMSKVPYYYLILVLFIIIIFVSSWINRSKMGYYLTALREDEDAALALGINTTRIKLVAAALSAFFSGIGGVYYAQLIRYLEPNAIAGAMMSNQIVFLAIIGGRGTVLGPALGGVLLTILGEITRVLFGQIMGLHLFLYGILVVLFVIFKPKGLIEFMKNLYETLIQVLEGRRAEGARKGFIGVEERNN
ncbi:branched-chain amino acid ABC transporter permease [Desulfofundulus salinus]|uniref:branched-chain amino acid ABC transporter permease n=1 Tax=Desulfofundulus salinus TaxID=2419843 RepID=UPI001401C663|nr:branched-chain amino acid ABC transporter permease [Desulfofundulus salinum]